MEYLIITYKIEKIIKRIYRIDKELIVEKIYSFILTELVIIYKSPILYNKSRLLNYKVIRIIILSIQNSKYLAKELKKIMVIIRFIYKKTKAEKSIYQMTIQDKMTW